MKTKRYPLSSSWLGFGLLAATLAVTLPAELAQAKLSKSGDAEVRFTAVGPGGFKIVGKTSELQLTDNADSIMTVVDLQHLDTGIELRDKHMRDKYLEVKMFPKAELTVKKSEIHYPKGKESSGDAHAMLTLHGKQKPVVFHYVATPEGSNKLAVKGSVEVNMKEFGIDVPTYLGITVKPKVEIQADFLAEDG